jgi:undecaprenyl diphosphate synthase
MALGIAKNRKPLHAVPMDKLHVAIIPDGNRRWAKTRGWLPWKGHEYAMRNFSLLLDWCREDGRIGVVSIWGFSTDNWKRDEEEVSRLMKLFEEFLRDERPKFHKHAIRFVHTGRRDRIPATLSALISEMEEETKDFTSFTIELCVDYSGRDELLRSLHKLKQCADVTEESLRACFDHPDIPDIDVIIRTSGEQRTSNFFLWQAAYAEWMFLQKHFPELTGEDIGACLDDFGRRQRRFGK